ncbi:MAG: peptidase M64 [Bacteroidales bacterium]|nr:peptidase M64 [Bacteroidales bacterium]
MKVFKLNDRRVYLILIIVLSLTKSLYSQIEYQKWFKNSALRIDMSHVGSKSQEAYYSVAFYQQDVWAGPKKYLIDTSGYGMYFFEVRDSASQTLIFSKPYNTLFGEWQETSEAEQNERAFDEVLRMPMPYNTISVTIFKRDKKNQLHELKHFYIDPKTYRLKNGFVYQFDTLKIWGSKPMEQAVDLAIIAEGYTIGEKEKFQKDAESMVEHLFNSSPFGDLKDGFNVYLVFSESLESGTDIPGDSIWKSTILNSHFYTFGSERYLTTQDLRAVHNVAQQVPYDQVYILVNTSKYGGGGIFNFYNLCSSSHALSPWVFIHEFGHGFAGLADEYYDSEVAFSDMYDLSTEPWRPNISTMVEPEKKWASRVEKETPIPTPEAKEYAKSIGFFEGGGYVEKGIYRPYLNCEMKSLKSGFCPICQSSIILMFNWATDH